MPRESLATISNAMDVGNPSNFGRILSLYDNDRAKIARDISGASVSDETTREVISDVWKKEQYLLDPHGAVGFFALSRFMETGPAGGWNGIVLETAHPAKFVEVLPEDVQSDLKMPAILAEVMGKEGRSVRIGKGYEELKEFLM